ncbi:MAG: YhjD/YihY/BrkB family envelope integrity protein [Actinomycetota bacterium]
MSGAVAQVKLRIERARARSAFVDVVVRTFRRFSEDDGGVMAASLTYYMFFSIFPMLLFAAAVLGYVTRVSETLSVQEVLRSTVDAFPLLGSLLTKEALDAIQDRSGQLALVGAVLALYSGSGGVVALAHALNRVNRIAQERNFLGKRLASLKWLAMLGIGVVLTIVLGAALTFAGPLAVAGAIVAGAALNIAIFTTAFKYLPNKRRTWSEILPGAVVAGIAFEILKQLGTLYLSSGQAGRDATFGAFATTATFLVASYLLAQVTLLAAEVNAVLAERRATRRSSVGNPIEEAEMSQVPTEPDVRSVNGQSTGQLMKEITEDLSTLVRKEVDLAKQELGHSVGAKAKGAVIIAVAGVLALFALIFLLLAIRDGIDSGLPVWAADLITAGILIVTGIVGALVAKRKLSTPISTDLTKQTIKDDVEWAKSIGRR